MYLPSKHQDMAVWSPKAFPLHAVMYRISFFPFHMKTKTTETIPMINRMEFPDMRGEVIYLQGNLPPNSCSFKPSSASENQLEAVGFADL